MFTVVLVHSLVVLSFCLFFVLFLNQFQPCKDMSILNTSSVCWLDSQPRVRWSRSCSAPQSLRHKQLLSA